ncbi:AGC/YANK protein kinase [Hysterangium stoloniferum]|nr:AGC/YANK protein kinase [Hysterangium stoloniferum]
MGALLCRPEPVDYEGEVDLFHFALLRNVGKGAFGKVRMVQHKPTKELYALKYIDKARCSKMKAVANIIQERRLLEEIDHPFVVNMRYAFQDDENCFFVLDLMLGGDLRFHLERMKTLPEDVVRLIVAEIASGLAYLHEKKIVHRDIKPDNVLLDAQGHAHITDFNVAVYHPADRLLTSIAGSKAYMAPEILQQKGYSYAVDWWSLGVTAFELAFGRRPFNGRKGAELTHAICRGTIKFPSDAEKRFSLQGLVALRELLERDPRQRLRRSSSGEMGNVKQITWFASIDWELLARKEIVSKLIPDADKPNFDLSHELEELLLEDHPLKKKRRKANRDVTRLSPEFRQLEEQFTVYDFREMRRRTYYPLNQQIASHVTSTSDAELESSRPTTPGPFVDADRYIANNMPPHGDLQAGNMDAS